MKTAVVCQVICRLTEVAGKVRATMAIEERPLDVFSRRSETTTVLARSASSLPTGCARSCGQRAGQRPTHATGRARSVGAWRRGVVGVGARAPAREVGVAGGTSGVGVAGAFEYEDPGALPQHEAMGVVLAE